MDGGLDLVLLRVNSPYIHKTCYIWWICVNLYHMGGLHPPVKNSLESCINNKVRNNIVATALLRILLASYKVPYAVGLLIYLFEQAISLSFTDEARRARGDTADDFLLDNTVCRVGLGIRK